MKLKFLRTLSIGREICAAGTVHDIKDRHAAEIYVAHGDAEPVEAADKAELNSTLKRSMPVPRRRPGT